MTNINDESTFLVKYAGQYPFNGTKKDGYQTWINSYAVSTRTNFGHHIKVGEYKQALKSAMQFEDFDNIRNFQVDSVYHDCDMCMVYFNVTVTKRD